jgi:predicted DNA-binding transcriptional regulator YafY
MEHHIRKGTYPNVETFCRLFDIQPRTVYEDLRLLKQMIGLSIAFDRLRNGYYTNDPEKKLPAFELTDDELTALVFAKELSSALTCHAFEEILESALDKIIDRNIRKLPLKPAAVRPFLRVLDAKAAPPPTRAFSHLLRALNEETVVALTYSMQNNEPCLTSNMEPFCLILQNGAWYLLAYCHTAMAPRVLPIEKLLSVKNTGERAGNNSADDMEAFIERFFEPAPAMRRKAENPDTI